MIANGQQLLLRAAQHPAGPAVPCKIPGGKLGVWILAGLGIAGSPRCSRSRLSSSRGSASPPAWPTARRSPPRGGSRARAGRAVTVQRGVHDAWLDVATAMMDGPGGFALVEESIREAIHSASGSSASDTSWRKAPAGGSPSSVRRGGQRRSAIPVPRDVPRSALPAAWRGRCPLGLPGRPTAADEIGHAVGLLAHAPAVRFPHGAAFLPGGSAPDAVLRAAQGIGQAHHAHRTAVADCLRCADLLQSGAIGCDGKEELRILALAGPPRHPAGPAGRARAGI